MPLLHELFLFSACLCSAAQEPPKLPDAHDVDRKAYDATAISGFAQIGGEAAYAAFMAWRNAPENRSLKWEKATEKYSAKLIAGGMKPAEAAKTISIISSRDEGAYYDPVYASPNPKFKTSPNKLLIDAVNHRKPGRALDVAMGQGRNAIYLARLGWDVTGFDTSKAGLEQAQKAARASGLQIRTVLASDEEFDFGTEKWDLIAIIYPIEKRSVYRVRQALKPGGIVVVECSHKEGANAPFEYDTNELLKIFEGFRIIKYQDTIDEHEWVRKQLRLVRLIAEK
jgi:SAM-dependent methyltransferase